MSGAAKANGMTEEQYRLALLKSGSKAYPSKEELAKLPGFRAPSPDGTAREGYGDANNSGPPMFADAAKAAKGAKPVESPKGTGTIEFMANTRQGERLVKENITSPADVDKYVAAGMITPEEGAAYKAKKWPAVASADAKKAGAEQAKMGEAEAFALKTEAWNAEQAEKLRRDAADAQAAKAHAANPGAAVPVEIAPQFSGSGTVNTTPKEGVQGQATVGAIVGQELVWDPVVGAYRYRMGMNNPSGTHWDGTTSTKSTKIK
jgi:hypothetical protein